MEKRQATRRCQAILLAVLAVAPLYPAFGLDPKEPVNSYLRTQFTMAYGLPSDIINGLAQAGRFLWIATPHVLARFDGWHFVQIGLDASLAYNALTTEPGGDLGWAP
jgi:hypothetical protein